MLKTREIKNKINVVQNLTKITGALELVSAVKMKKSQRLALNSRPFVRIILEILDELAHYQKEIKKSVFFQERPVKKILAVVIASDRGFCGPFNRNILLFADKEIEKMNNVEIFPVGKKAIKFFKKKNYPIFSETSGIGDFGELEETKPIADKLLEVFQKDIFQQIFLFYTDFISSFLQQPRKVQILPLKIEVIEGILENYRQEKGEEVLKNYPVSSAFHILPQKGVPYLLLEPSPEEIFDNLVPQLIRQMVHHTILETNAAEHSARMMAMKRAADNAKEILENLILDYNKARQNQITAEISEITSAKEATS